MVGAGAGLSEQGTSEQALHFAHDLLGNALPGLPWIECSCGAAR